MNVQTDTLAVEDDENLALLNSDNETPVNIRARSTVSWIMGAGLIINAAIGVSSLRYNRDLYRLLVQGGLLNLAKAYNDAGGIFVSSILHAIVVILVLGAYAILIVCCDSSTGSYETFVLMKCGKVWQRICSVCIILYMYGLSITFFIIIGDQLHQFFSFVATNFCEHPWYYDRKFTITITALLFILPLCFSKSMKFLQIPSMLGVLAIIYVVIIVPVQYFESRPTHADIKTRPDSWTDIFLVLPTMCFCYQAHVNAIPVFVALKSRADCIKATLAATIILIFSYCLVAICGYLTFGKTVDHDILMSYKNKSASILIAIIMIAIKTFVGYPVNLFCGRTAIDSLTKDSAELTIATDAIQSTTRRILIVSLWFFSTLVAAVFLPDISVAIHYLGALAASFIFIFPGLCLYFHIEETWINSWGNIISISIGIFYVAIGVFITVLTILQSLIADISNKETSSRDIC